MGYEAEIRAKAEMHGIKQNIYDWYRNQTWLQEIATTYGQSSSHGGDKYEKVKRPYGIVHDVVNDMILWTDAGPVMWSAERCTACTVHLTSMRVVSEGDPSEKLHAAGRAHGHRAG